MSEAATTTAESLPPPSTIALPPEAGLTLIYAIALGLAIAATATVARRSGERDREGAARAATQAILLSAAIAAIIGVVGLIFAPHALSLMGASSDVIANGTGYAR